MMTESDLQRFLVRFVVNPDTECWDWIAAINPSGYGNFWLYGKMRSAHRIAYEIWTGPMPIGLETDHLCRNRKCVNPDHLEAVTKRTNCLRGQSPAAIHARRTHCPKGHEFSFRSNGRRYCEQCYGKEFVRDWKRRQREAGRLREWR